MNREQIQTRIEELENLKKEKTQQRAEALAAAEIKKTELNEIQRKADDLNWINTIEAKELEELKIVIKYL